jgi:CRP-like cAMP-binding protein
MKVANRKVANRKVANSLLAALSGKNYQRLLPGLEPVTLNFGDVLYETGQKMQHVYFPDNSLVSLLTVVNGRMALEVGMVGREGMVGIPLALGTDVSPVRALVQGAGTAMRMKSARFSREIRKSPQLQHEVYGYANALMAQVSQTAACNRFHVVEARLARWLLMTRDRMRSREFRLTQEFLSHMLGVRRVGVTHAARALQDRKLIDYSRGKISILDDKGLEAAACECYALVNAKTNGADTRAGRAWS